MPFYLCHETLVISVAANEQNDFIRELPDSCNGLVGAQLSLAISA